MAEDDILQRLGEKWLVLFLHFVWYQCGQGFWGGRLFEHSAKHLLYLIHRDVLEGQSDALVPDLQVGQVAGVGQERALDACTGPREPEQIAAFRQECPTIETGSVGGLPCRGQHLPGFGVEVNRNVLVEKKLLHFYTNARMNVRTSGSKERRQFASAGRLHMNDFAIGVDIQYAPPTAGQDKKLIDVRAWQNSNAADSGAQDEPR